MSPYKVPKVFTLDFKKLCREELIIGSKACAVGQFLRACGVPDDRIHREYGFGVKQLFPDNADEAQSVLDEISDLNDNERSKELRSKGFKELFGKLGVKLKVVGV